MASDLDERSLTDEVVRSFASTPDPRLRQILTALVTHAHGFIREVRLTQDEWSAAVEFLTAVGQTCTPTRQEFVLLSDILGISMLVEAMNGAEGETATESTVLGPFHVVESPVRELGDSIDLVGQAPVCVVTGRVVGPDGQHLGGARVDVWQSDDQGFYDVQVPDRQPAGNGRGLFTAADDGTFWFRTVVPSHYPIPTDGPVGRLLTSTGRHPFRPAHIHFIVEADGFRPVTTHVFVAGSRYIESDAVFAVKSSLIVDVVSETDPELAARYGVTAPFQRITVEFVLARDTGAAAS